MNEALSSMITMGFTNKGDWLNKLLQIVDGNISKAFNHIQPRAPSS